MNQNRYGVFVSLILLLCLTAGFFFAARFAVKAVNSSVAKAIDTATVVVLPPTATPPPPSPTPRGFTTKKHHHVVAGPAPTATPLSNNQIVISTSNLLSGATTSFPANTSRYWCVANLPNVPLSTGIVWKWEQVTGNTTQAIWTSPPYTYANPLRYGYMEGPFQAGHYRCTVIAGNEVVGAADFTVQ